MADVAGVAGVAAVIVFATQDRLDGRRGEERGISLPLVISLAKKQASLGSRAWLTGACTARGLIAAIVLLTVAAVLIALGVLNHF